MIDDHLYEQARRRIFHGWFGDVRTGLALLGGVVIVVTQIVGLVILLTHH